MPPAVEKPKTIKELAEERKLSEIKGYAYDNTYSALGWDHKDHYDGGCPSKYDPRDPLFRRDTQRSEPVNRLKRYQF